MGVIFSYFSNKIFCGEDRKSGDKKHNKMFEKLINNHNVNNEKFYYELYNDMNYQNY